MLKLVFLLSITGAGTLANEPLAGTVTMLVTSRSQLIAPGKRGHSTLARNRSPEMLALCATAPVMILRDAPLVACASEAEKYM